MAERMEEQKMTGMVQAFLQSAGGDELLAALCGKLLEEQGKGSVCLPVPEEARGQLSASRLVSILPDDSRPFVFDPEKGNLYTRRNWKYEECVRRRIGMMAKAPSFAEIAVPETGDFAHLKECQRRAIQRMGSRQFTILTGGPGTGKTYTISRAVKLIREQAPEVRNIGLAAPTGKAAARVREAMGEADAIPAVTIHSLLGANHDFVTFRHDRNHPLALDWLIVDEASMIDLPLMAKLLDALGENCRLTLVGDANQLTSVEPGHVFGDLCAMPELQDCIAELTESSRVLDGGAILRLAEAVNRGDEAAVLMQLKQGADATVGYCPSATGGQGSASFREMIRDRFAPFCSQRTPEGALKTLNECRVLCAVRRGPCGTDRINAFILKMFRQECPVPLMITRNDSALGVSNGDVGVLMPDDKERLHLFSEGRERAVPLALLPELELAFATTIHKSQGSEFDHVVIVLPQLPEGEEPTGKALTRELLYTAVTRAKKSVTLFADETAVRLCCRQRTKRHTGLGE